jgi:undecaprenyl diphosphate synthase
MFSRFFGRGGGGKQFNHVAVSLDTLDIPILSVLLLSGKRVGTDFSSKVKHFDRVLEGILLQFLHEHQIKVSPIGKWYELPGGLVDRIKGLIDETKEYDRFFLNLCVYYEGQAEIVDATKLIGRRIRKEMLTPEEITKETIKDNIYFSHFLAPELIIIPGCGKLGGFMLWDAAEAYIHFTNTPWQDFSEGEFRRIVEEYSTRHPTTKAI